VDVGVGEHHLHHMLTPPPPFPFPFLRTHPQLEAGTDADRDTIFEELLAAPLPVMNDMFGNYLLQHFLRSGTPEQK
jgi:hypothetical protein